MMLPDLDRLAALLPRYDLAGPRYTSYPTAPMWSDDFAADAYARALGRIGQDADAGIALYVHIPFCESLCHYCACNRVITRDEALPERYLDALEREVAAVRKRVPASTRAAQIHLGGGTPTHLTPEQLTRLMAMLDRAFPRTPEAELSIEVDPRVTTPEHIDALYACGYRRISLGVQDFDPEVQQAIHRIQPIEQVEALTRCVRERGFESVNFDLIYGLPFQTRERFDATLDAVFRLAPDRVALYSYAHVTWVAKQQRGFERIDLPGPETKLEIMLSALQRFFDAGYVHIGMDHFARRDDALATAAETGELHRNFMGYTTRVCGDLVGFGPSAISRCGGVYAQSRRELGAWMETAAAGGLATFRGHALDPEDERRAWVIEQIMCAGGVEAEAYRKCFGRDFGTDFAEEIERLAPFERDELLCIDASGGFRVTPTGGLLLRNIAMPFDAYLEAPRAEAPPMFSRTV